MITLVLRYINKVVQLALVAAIVFVCVKGVRGQSDVIHETREFSVVEPTFMVEDEEPDIIIETEANIASDAYSETKSWSIKFPEIDLPNVDGVSKDAYGNYVITKEMFDTGSNLPLNDDGYIDYIYYYDADGNVLNPFPELYNNYLDYFGLNGG